MRDFKKEGANEIVRAWKRGSVGAQKEWKKIEGGTRKAEITVLF
jgi:hypothetical protein